MLLIQDVDGVFQDSKVFHECCLISSSVKVDIDVDANLISRLVQDQGKDTTRGRFMDGDIGVQFFLPEGESATMSSGFLEGQEVIEAVLGIKKEVIQITYLVSRKGSIWKVEPGLTEEDESWILRLY